MASSNLDPADLRVTAQRHRSRAARESDPEKQKMHIQVAVEFDRLADEIEAHVPRPAQVN